jgi:hypothetical protein
MGACLLLVGSSVLIGSNAAGQNYQTCDSDPNPPAIECDPPTTTLSWTDTAHCQSHPACNSACVPRIATIKQHSIPITWNGDFVKVRRVVVGSESYPGPVPTGCFVIHLGQTPDGWYDVYSVQTPTQGTDQTTDVQGETCAEIHLG